MQLIGFIAANQYGMLAAGTSAAGSMLNYPAMLPGQDLAHHMTAGLDFTAGYNPQLVGIIHPMVRNGAFSEL